MNARASNTHRAREQSTTSSTRAAHKLVDFGFGFAYYYLEHDYQTSTKGVARIIRVQYVFVKMACMIVAQLHLGAE